MFWKPVSILVIGGVVPVLLLSQERALVEGKVVDVETRKPLPDVNLTVRGKNLGTSTDSLGRFRLPLPAGGSYVLAFTHIAYEKVVKEAVLDRSDPTFWRIEMRGRAIPLREVVVVAGPPFSEKRALYTIEEAEFERLGEPDMDRALRYLLPFILNPLDVRMRFPSRDFTLYVNGEWKESIYVMEVDPFRVRRVIVWDGEWSPVGLPARRGNYVVSIITR